MSTSKKKLNPTKKTNIYSSAILTKTIVVPINNVGDNIASVLQTILSSKFEEKCNVEGYIKKDSIKIITYSSGLVTNGVNIKFDVVFECLICLPVEGMQITCKATNITKAGIKAQIDVESGETSPLIIFVSRDHEYESEFFSSIKENMIINVKVIGQRFELNDKFISVIAELIKPKAKKTKKPKLILSEDT